MKTAKLKTIEQSDNVSLYSICFNNNKESEFEKFIKRFKDEATLNKDFQKIFRALNRVIARGALERDFRYEGKMNDRVAALSVDSQKLRLYCLRISDQILIAGNGGIKNTRTYQESEELNGYVLDLQKFDNLLAEAIDNEIITIEKNMIIGIENATFKL